MDERRFDQLTRALGGASSRRGALAGLAGLGASAAAGVSTAEAGKKRKKCYPSCPSGQTCQRGSCACDNGGAVCGATCCATGQRCENGACVAPPVPCVPAGAACKGVGAPCCDGFVCGSGQGGKQDVACYVPAGGACAATAECVYDSTCKGGFCVANPRPTPAPACTPSFPVTGDAAANGAALQKAVLDAESGDTIVLAGGDYRFNAQMSSVASLYIDGKSLAIERCSEDAVVNLVCHLPGGPCVAARGPVSGPGTSVSLHGVVVKALQSGLGLAVSAFVSARLELENVTVEVASPGLVGIMAFGGPSSNVTVKSGVVVRTSDAAPTAAALRTFDVGTITCMAPPTLIGYDTAAERCNAQVPGTIAADCGCQV